MLYSEFVENTGCKENEHNYNVYKNLEVMYMNSDMSKNEIYEYGKKLVDNSKSQKQIEFENDLKNRIEEQKNAIQSYRSDIECYERWINELTDDDDYLKREYKSQISWRKNDIKNCKQTISRLKEILKSCI